MAIKSADLPAEAVLLSDGRYFVPFKQRDEPKGAAPAAHPQFRALEDLDDEEAAVLLISAARKERHPVHQAAMPTKDAPPLQYNLPQ